MKLSNMLALAVLAPLAASAQLNLLTNGGFEDPIVASGTAAGNVSGPLIQYTDAVNGWQTDAAFVPPPGGKFEIWTSGVTRNDLGVTQTYLANVGPAPLLNGGSQWAELNAFEASALFQDATATVVGELQFSFLQRGRIGGVGQNDILRFSIIDLGVNASIQSTLDTTTGVYTILGDDKLVYSNVFGADRTAWVQQSGSTGVTSIAGEKYRFAYASVSAFGGSQALGNFLDNAAFGVSILQPVPEPSTYGLIGALALVGFVFVRRFSKSKSKV